MTQYFKLAFILFSFSTFAQNLDAELNQYVEIFNFAAVEKPKGFNKDLFALGKSLFFEKEVSGNRNISCSTCHDLKNGTSDNLPLPIGAGGIGLGKERIMANGSKVIPRNSPALFNIGDESLEVMFWDGRVKYSKKFLEFTTPDEGLNGDYPDYFEITDIIDSALAAQALFPPTSHAEMRGEKGQNELADAKTNREVWKRIMKRLLRHGNYNKLFKSAYPQDENFNIGHFAKALAHFQKHAFSVTQTPWDQYLRGNKKALSQEEKRGAILFATKGRCANCHNGALLGGSTFQNVTSPQIGPGKDIKKNDEGLFYTTGKHQHRYAFKTPMLRNVKLSAPYFHSGVFETLDEVIDHYALGANGIDNYNSDHLKKYEAKNYLQSLFVETDNYMLFRKKETTHPLMRGHRIKLTKREKNLIKLFLEKSLSAKTDMEMAL